MSLICLKKSLHSFFSFFRIPLMKIKAVLIFGDFFFFSELDFQNTPPDLPFYPKYSVHASAESSGTVHPIKPMLST